MNVNYGATQSDEKLNVIKEDCRKDIDVTIR